MRKVKLFTLACLALALVITSCKKEITEPVVQASAPPQIMRYNILDSSASFENNSSTVIAGYTGKYAIKYLYNTGKSQVFGYAFPQRDSGEIWFSGDVNGKRRYMVITSEHDLGGWNLHAKAGVGTDDLSVFPTTLTDTTLFFTVTHKVTGRTLRILSSEFRSQVYESTSGFCTIMYDTP